MPGKILLDTTIIIALFNANQGVISAISDIQEIFTPSIAVGELFYGAIKSGQAERNLAKIRDFAQANTVIPITAQTGEAYGRVKNRLRERGRPIPENDIRIAALALQHGLDLATRDAHFGEVEGLRFQQW